MKWNLLLTILYPLVMLILTTQSRVISKHTQKSHYNIILVLFDDLRPVIGSYGDFLALTPHLDALSQKSYIFMRAYSQQSLCAPSRNSFLTSRRPDTLHLYDFYSYWRSFAGNFTTLPQYFKEHGYYTYSIGKVFHPGYSSNHNDDYPFSWSAKPFHPNSEEYMNAAVCNNGYEDTMHWNLICPVELHTQPLGTLPDIQSVTEAIQFIQRFGKRKEDLKTPYFLALGFHKPHINFRFPQYYLTKFPLENFYNYTNNTYKSWNIPTVAWNPFTDLRLRDDFRAWDIPFPFGSISWYQRAQLRQAYYASVAYVDDLFGELMSHVNFDNTIVMVTSDHGWSLGEHAEWAKYSNFEVALRVPLIVYTPEMLNGFKCRNHSRRINELVELVDLFPSLVDLAHLPSIARCKTKSSEKFPQSQLLCTEGESFYPLMRRDINVSSMKRIALSQYPRPGIYPTKHPNSDKPRLDQIHIMGYSMRTDNYRYTMWVRFYPKNFSRDWSQLYGEEMYDHRLTDNEEKNLVLFSEFDNIRFLLRRKLIKIFSY